MSDTATGIFTGDLETGSGAAENFRVGDSGTGSATGSGI